MSGIGNAHGINVGFSTVPEFYDQSSLSSTSTIKLESVSPSPSSSCTSMMDALSNNPILTTASVPIPSRHANQRMITDPTDYFIEIDQSQSPHMLQDISFITTSNNSNLSASTPVDTIFTLQNISDAGIVGDGIQINTININGFGNAEIWNADTFGQIISPSSTVSSATNAFGQQGQFHMDEDDIYQLDKDELIGDATLGDIFANDLLHEDLMLMNAPLSQPSPNLSADSGSGSGIHLSPSLPQQILRSNANSSANNNIIMTMGTNVQQTNDLHVPTMHELYDEQTRISTSPYATNTNISSPATFSPGSHSSSPSLGYSQAQTPPLQNRLHQQLQMNAMNNNSRLMKMESPEQTKNQNLTNNNFSRNAGNVGQVQYNAKYSTLQQLLMSNTADRSGMMLGQSVPGSSSVLMSGASLSPGSFNGRRMMHHMHAQAGSSHSGIGGAGSGGGTSGGTMSRLSSSAPTHMGMDVMMWQRREPRPHLLSTGSLAEAGSTSSLSTGSVLSPEAPDFSHDEGYSDDSDHYEDFSSGDDSDTEDMGQASGSAPSSSKAKRYFWQYNVQAKGPKGQRLVIKTHTEDPHFLNEVTDPVFSPSCSVRGIKNLRLQHSGKARKGDGNDLTPNPKKLHSIGKELDKLGRVINDMTPVSELPFNARPKTRKEKNKLASRACRLKKKAQHEANKLKLYGLETEHKRLMNGIKQMKQILVTKCSQVPTEPAEDQKQKMDTLVSASTKLKIAGNSTEFVNKILDVIKSGNSVNIDKVLEEF